MSWLSIVFASVFPPAKRALQRSLDDAKPFLKASVDAGVAQARAQAQPGTALFANTVAERVLAVASARKLPLIVVIYLRGLVDQYRISVVNAAAGRLDDALDDASDALKRAIDGARL